MKNTQKINNVGDSIFFIKNKTIKRGTIKEINFNVKSEGVLEYYYAIGLKPQCGSNYFYSFQLFKTKKEAEAVLKEIKKLEERHEIQSNT